MEVNIELLAYMAEEMQSMSVAVARPLVPMRACKRKIHFMNHQQNSIFLTFSNARTAFSEEDTDLQI